jgi:aryl-alcohol dehydrogenase-like predicted oxidoreductase
MIKTLIAEGIPEDSIVKNSGHCLHPTFLRRSVEESLQRLNLQTLDIVYIHNPYEAQGPFNTDAVFYDRLQQAFETMEQLVSENKIRAYGIATYSSLRVKPTEQKIHLNIQKVERLAQKVAGKSHNMRFVQVPVKVMMPESFVEPW